MNLSVKHPRLSRVEGTPGQPEVLSREDQRPGREHPRAEGEQLGPYGFPRP